MLAPWLPFVTIGFIWRPAWDSPNFFLSSHGFSSRTAGYWAILGSVSTNPGAAAFSLLLHILHGSYILCMVLTYRIPFVGRVGRASGRAQVMSSLGDVKALGRLNT